MIDVLLTPVMFATHNIIPVLLCVVAYMLIGWLWYGPIFSKPWSKMTGVDKWKKADMKKTMMSAMIVSLVGALIQASVLGLLISNFAMDAVGIPTALAMIFLFWLAFTGSVMATCYAYTKKPVKLLLIDALYPLLAWFAMALILMMWMSGTMTV
jgi:hypothetical protein